MASERKPRLFYLNRRVDESGVSGTGIVAHGVLFHDGTAVMRWNTDKSSTAIYNSIDDLMGIHGHGGATEVVFWES